jgi:hypothetical protein
MKSLLYILLFLSIPIVSWGQSGNQFWFVAPEVSASHSDNPICLRLTAMDKDVSVSVSMPADPSLTPITKQINANQQVTINLNEGFFTLLNVENKPYNTLLNKGIFIQSTGGDISAIYEVSSSNNPEDFVLKGNFALGTEFYVPGQNSFTNHNYGNFGIQPYERVDIVATEDNTVITILPSVNIKGGMANTPITINLNRGQTYGIVADDWSTASVTMAGTKISSSKNIAVTISDDSIEELRNVSKAWDLIGDQIIPTSTIGNEYIGVKTSTLNGAINRVYVLAIQPNTSVSIDGSASTIMEKGEVMAIDIVNSSVHIKSTENIYAYQVSGINNGQTLSNEMGSALLAPIGCGGSQSVQFTRHFPYRYWVHLTVQSKNIGKFKMYNSNTENPTFSSVLNSLTWQIVEGTNNGKPDDVWYTTVINMSSAPFNISTGQVYSITNTLGNFQLGVLEENAASINYGILTNYANRPIVKIEGGDNYACSGDLVVLQALNSSSFNKWVSPLTDEVISTNNNLTVTQTGSYILRYDDGLGCMADDTTNIEFKQIAVDLGEDKTIINGESLELSLNNASDFIAFRWTNTEIPSFIATTPSITITEPGTYRLEVMDTYGCATSDIIKITANNIPTQLHGIKDIKLEAPIITSDNIELLFGEYRASAKRIVIQTIDGKSIGSYDLPKGCESYKIENSNLKPGIYFCTLFMDDKLVETIKIIKK